MIKIGSLFAGIGGFELGIERAIPNAKTVWQVERDPFCQKVLAKHWPDAKIYNDVCTVGAHNLEAVDIICGGFPCQDISVAGAKKGVIKDETRSGLWWEMHRIISELRPRIAILENVANVLTLGGSDVVGSLAKIGYDCEWTIISADMFGAPHKRRRWFCVAYSARERLQKDGNIANSFKEKGISPIIFAGNIIGNDQRTNYRENSYWQKNTHPAPVRRMDDGISRPMDAHRIKALGNAIVPQCSEWVAQQILASDLLDDLLEGK